jgi:hypothetical protein
MLTGKSFTIAVVMFVGLLAFAMEFRCGRHVLAAAPR